MTNFNDFLNEQMKDPEFKAEWDALDPEFSVIEAMLKARKESGLTQKQLSERTGIAQTDISKLERGNANPSLRTLQRLAAGMGMKVKIEFVPASVRTSEPVLCILRSPLHHDPLKSSLRWYRTFCDPHELLSQRSHVRSHHLTDPLS